MGYSAQRHAGSASLVKLGDERDRGCRNERSDQLVCRNTQIIYGKRLPMLSHFSRSFNCYAILMTPTSLGAVIFTMRERFFTPTNRAMAVGNMSPLVRSSRPVMGSVKSGPMPVPVFYGIERKL